MNQSSLNRRLTQAVGIFLGMAIAVWILRGFEILTSLPGGIILLFFAAAIVTAVISYVQNYLTIIRARPGVVVSTEEQALIEF